jgi:predicted Rossmann fold flavoprotein
MVGTTIEFFDYYIYAAAAVLVFNTQFFHSGDPLSDDLLSLSTLALAFFARPIGSAILQISNYWQPGESIHLDLLPYNDIRHHLDEMRQSSPKLQLKTVLSRLLPKKLVELWLEQGLIQDEVIANLSKVRLENLENLIHNWQFIPNGTEGYRTAEVTMGGVDTHEISSKTMEATKIKGLYFIGEVVDVVGWLGGYNFQWAWSSAAVCAMGIAES